jgi:signal transduction histidine kinase
MKLPPEGARWFVRLRWIACLLVLASVSLGKFLGAIPDARPHYLVAAAMLAYNAFFWGRQRAWEATQKSVDRHITAQILCDVAALTLLLYFSDLPRNPFLFYYVLPMVISGMYLRGRSSYAIAVLVTVLVGGLILSEHLQWLPRYTLHVSRDAELPLGGFYLLTLFLAFASTLWMTLYFVISIRVYVDRAHEEIRQKEKMVGIGQLVAGISHQIANPLDGVQNCLRRIGERLKDDAHWTEYVKMMEEALDRIEKTTKRVQAFARPRGLTLQDTSVNAAVESTVQLIGTRHGDGISIQTELGEVPLVRGDPYTLQEVLFNLCINAMAAMPQGGVLKLRTFTPGPHDESAGHVAVEVSDTGIGIPLGNLEKIFEPFFTTRAENGGTGLGLALCRMLIAEMDGSIQVRSELNQGSTFTLILQRAAASRPRIE